MSRYLQNQDSNQQPTANSQHPMDNSTQATENRQPQQYDQPPHTQIAAMDANVTLKLRIMDSAQTWFKQQQQPPPPHINQQQQQSIRNCNNNTTTSAIETDITSDIPTAIATAITTTITTIVSTRASMNVQTSVPRLPYSRCSSFSCVAARSSDTPITEFSGY